VPGAYPSAVIKGHNSTDFMRTIQLTVENPVQPIGRSSRNEAKGLFAARDNGFFESPVMSRSHAEVKITLEPRRKVGNRIFFGVGKKLVLDCSLMHILASIFVVYLSIALSVGTLDFWAHYNMRR
jgi:hypothetical protein